MSSLKIDLDDDEAERLAALAEREGATPQAFAAAAVRARLDEETRWDAEVTAGIAEMDAGLGMSIEDFEREMDAFVARLNAQRA